MKQQARVQSIEVIQRFRLQLQEYQQSLRQTLEHLSSELSRGMDWFHADRPQYWKQQVTRSSNRLSEALANYECCKLAAPKELSNACQEERLAVERAKERQRYCEQQLTVIKTWTRNVDQQSDDFESHVARLQSYNEQDLTRAIAMLMRIEEALNKYAEVRTPDITTSPPAATAESIETAGGPNSGETQ